MLVLDRSGSMASAGKLPPEPLTSVKNTATSFIAQLKYGDSAGVVSFATKASDPVDQSLTSNFDQAKTAIQSIVISTSTTDKNTNIGDGIQKAISEFSIVDETGVNTKKVIVLLTDGEPTDPKQKGQDNYPTLFALTSANDARTKGIDIFAIGLGNQVNQDILLQIVGKPERFFFAPNTETLAGIYKKIASSICVRKPNVIEIISRDLSK
jgi:Mg-chelatase subunit ChlD